MRTVTVDLFSGIGGFAVASHQMGWETMVCCEIDTDCQVVLRHHFPAAYIHGDIHTLTWEIINEEIEKRLGYGWRESTRVVVCGGFPCQSHSLAGKRKGRDDDRYLWPEMLRIIQECKPDAVVGENVLGIISIEGGLVFQQVQTDLEAQGFEVQSVVVPACAVGAPHRRDRVWFVANPAYQRFKGQGKFPVGGLEDKSERGGLQQSITNPEIKQGKRHKPELLQVGIEKQIQLGGVDSQDGCGGIVADPPIEGREERIQDGIRKNPKEGRGGLLAELERPCSEPIAPYTRGGGTNHWADFPTEWPLRVGDDGLSARLGGIRLPGSGKRVTESSLNKMTLKMAGNAIVPQVAVEIFKALQSTWEE